MPAQRPRRDARIDIVRGLALLIIFINHMPGNVVARWMPHNFGFADAADIFVMLAGVSATLAYGVVIERQGLGVCLRLIGLRLWKLYLAHIAVFLLVCAIVATAVTSTHNPLYIEAINIQPLLTGGLSALADALMLTYQPYYLDILPLYIVLLALFPAVYAAVKVSPALALAASVAIWQGAWHLGLNLPNTGSAGWFFNPFAWQLVFTIGVAIGRCMQLGVAAPRAWLVDVAAIACLGLALAIKLSSGNPFGIAMLNDWIEMLQIGSDKTNLSVVRILHLAALCWVFIRLVPVTAAMLSSAVGRNLAVIGRHSLPVFCAGIVLSVAGQIILAEAYFALGVQLLVCLTGVTMLVGLGICLSWHQSSAYRGSAGQPSPAVRHSALQA